MCSFQLTAEGRVRALFFCEVFCLFFVDSLVHSQSNTLFVFSDTPKSLLEAVVCVYDISSDRKTKHWKTPLRIVVLLNSAINYSLQNAHKSEPAPQQFLFNLHEGGFIAGLLGLRNKGVATHCISYQRIYLSVLFRYILKHDEISGCQLRSLLVCKSVNT